MNKHSPEARDDILDLIEHNLKLGRIGYFISYNAMKTGYPPIIGNYSTYLDHPIRNILDIQDIEIKLAKDSGFDNVVVTYYHRLQNDTYPV